MTPHYIKFGIVDERRDPSTGELLKLTGKLGGLRIVIEPVAGTKTWIVSLVEGMHLAGAGR
jgi:hypothetical protein